MNLFFNQLNLHAMAKVPFGILGPFSGTVGPVTGSKWKIKDTMRSLRSPSKRDEHPTPEQLKQRTRFGFTSHFMKGLGPLVRNSFRELAIGNTEFQCAVSYNVCNAVSADDSGYTVHYERVSLGRGTLPNAVLPEAKAGDAPGDIRFIWADNTGLGTAAANDTAIVIAYDPALERWLYKKTPVAKRADCSEVFSLPGSTGKKLHTWLMFISDGGKASDSVYTGEVLVAGQV
jgi:hypothetical protein